MDLHPCSRAPGSQDPPCPCGSLPAWSPPSPGPHLTDRSPAHLQRLDNRRNHRRIRSTTGSDRDAVHFNLDDPAICLAHRFALPVSTWRRYHCVHHRRHKLYFVSFGMTACCFSQLTSPAKQLLRRQSMPSSHGTHRVATRHDLRDDPHLVLVAPLPPTTGSGEDLEPPHRLRDSSMHCVHSKPNGPNRTADSQITPSSGRWPLNSAYGVPNAQNVELSAPELCPASRSLAPIGGQM